MYFLVHCSLICSRDVVRFENTRLLRSCYRNLIFITCHQSILIELEPKGLKFVVYLARILLEPRIGSDSAIRSLGTKSGATSAVLPIINIKLQICELTKPLSSTTIIRNHGFGRQWRFALGWCVSPDSVVN